MDNQKSLIIDCQLNRKVLQLLEEVKSLNLKTTEEVPRRAKRLFSHL